MQKQHNPNNFKGTEFGAVPLPSPQTSEHIHMQLALGFAMCKSSYLFYLQVTTLKDNLKLSIPTKLMTLS